MRSIMAPFQLYIVMGFSPQWRPRLDERNGMAAENGASQTKTTGRQLGAIVKGVDRVGQQLPISQGAISEVGMPAMTMTFPAGDSSHLAMLHEGDTVAIHVANRRGVIQIVDFHMIH